VATLDSRYVNVTGDTMTGALVITADSTSIFNVTKADTTPVFNVDTTNKKVTTVGLHVDGDFTNYNSLLTDMGVEQTSSRIGLSKDYITDKAIAHCKVGANDNTDEGSIRYIQPNFQIYRNSAWVNLTVDISTRLDSVYGYVIEYIPAGFTDYYELMSGNSADNISLSGLPVIQGYKISMGAYSMPPIIYGGTF